MNRRARTPHLRPAGSPGAGLVLGLATSISTPSASAGTHVNAPQVTQLPAAEAVAEYDRGIQEIREENWAEAQRILTAVVQAHPGYGGAWYQLAYCKLAAGDAEGAAEGWLRSIDLHVLPAESRYNRACALALQGEVERAIDALEAAVAHGYVEVGSMMEDGDLASLRDHERFLRLANREPFPATAGGTSVTFASADEQRTVFGAWYPAAVGDPHETTTFLLFHQAGSNYAEYFPIAPRIAEMGFNVLTIDALGGGERWGRANETVRAHGERGGGQEAIEDFLGALAYLEREGFSGPRVLWGSSYSVGGSLQLLTEGRKDLVAGILFSGGRALSFGLEDGTTVASNIHVPVFLAAPIWEYDADEKAGFDAIASECKWLYVPTIGGAHGSSLLREDRNPEGHEDAWRELTAFIETHVRGAGLAGAEPSD